jgi:hypothetical protein
MSDRCILLIHGFWSSHRRAGETGRPVFPTRGFAIDDRLTHALTLVAIQAAPDRVSCIDDRGRGS